MPPLLAIFDQVNLPEALSVLPIVAFLCFFAAFIMIMTRAFRMSGREVERLSRLPLEEQPPTPPAP